MALLWIEGFEGFGTTTGSQPLPADVMARKYATPPAGYSYVDIEAGRVGGYSLEMGDNAYVLMPVPTTDPTLIFGCAFYIHDDDDEQYEFMALYEGATKGVSVRKTYTNELSIMFGGAALDTTVGLNVLDKTWYYIELKVLTDNAAGTYELKVGGVTVLSDTGVDTQPGSNAWSDTARIRGPGGVAYVWFDDIYICDGTGGANDDFLGQVRVVGLAPDADDTANFGTSTPSANHFENVDENPCDDDTSYVEENTANTTDLYDYEDLSVTGEIFGLQINTMCRETDATPFSLITPIESNGTQDDDSSQALPGVSYTNLHRVSEVDPDTNLAWTVNGVNAAKFGIKVG